MMDNEIVGFSLLGELKLNDRCVHHQDESRPHSMDRLGMQAGRGQVPAAAIHCLLSVVNNVKGTGDAIGIIDNAKRRISVAAAIKGAADCAAPKHSLAFARRVVSSQ
jgi:hypothetical protein